MENKKADKDSKLHMVYLDKNYIICAHIYRKQQTRFADPTNAQRKEILFGGCYSRLNVIDDNVKID